MFSRTVLLCCLVLTGFSYMSRTYAGMPSRTYLIGWQRYLHEMAQQFMLEIEDYGLGGIFLTDFNQNISQNFFGHQVNGQVLYTEGFWGSMQKAYLRESYDQYYVDEYAMTAQVKCKMILEQVLLYFDFYANLTSGTFGGTVSIPYESVEFFFYVTKDLSTGTIDGSFSDFSAKIPQNSKWYYEPNNAVTQIIFRSAKYSFFDDLYKLGNTTLKDILNMAITKLPFPELCFNCNSKTDD